MSSPAPFLRDNCCLLHQHTLLLSQALSPLCCCLLCSLLLPVFLTLHSRVMCWCLTADISALSTLSPGLNLRFSRACYYLANASGSPTAASASASFSNSNSAAAIYSPDPFLPVFSSLSSSILSSVSTTEPDVAESMMSGLMRGLVELGLDRVVPLLDILFLCHSEYLTILK